MPLSTSEYLVVEDLTELLYEFLPASGNNSTAFPLAAKMAGIPDLWVLDGSKRPAIQALLQRTLLQRRDRFPSLMLCIVRQSVTWRKKRGSPLTRREVDQANELILKLGYKVKDLLAPDFLAGLAGDPPAATKSDQSAAAPSLFPKADVLAKLNADLLALSKLDPQPRGFKFEAWLKDLFEAYQLAPRGSFRLVGEQIDGSFELNGQTYLVEAKWQNGPTGQADLLVFSGKVAGKAIWSRGLFISYSGYTADGLVAFDRGRQTNIIAMDGLDLSRMLERSVSFVELLGKKVREATHSNRAHVPFDELY